MTAGRWPFRPRLAELHHGGAGAVTGRDVAVPGAEQRAAVRRQHRSLQEPPPGAAAITFDDPSRRRPGAAVSSSRSLVRAVKLVTGPRMWSHHRKPSFRPPACQAGSEGIPAPPSHVRVTLSRASEISSSWPRGWNPLVGTSTVTASMRASGDSARPVTVSAEPGDVSRRPATSTCGRPLRADLQQEQPDGQAGVGQVLGGRDSEGPVVGRGGDRRDGPGPPLQRHRAHDPPRARVVDQDPDPRGEGHGSIEAGVAPAAVAPPPMSRPAGRPRPDPASVTPASTPATATTAAAGASQRRARRSQPARARLARGPPGCAGAPGPAGPAAGAWSPGCGPLPWPDPGAAGPQRRRVSSLSPPGWRGPARPGRG